MLFRVIEPSDDHPQELNEEQIDALLATGRWVRSAQRQEKRLQDAWVPYVEIRSRYPASVWDQIPEVVPADLAAVDERLADELYYFLLVAHQALLNGPKVVRETGLSLPKAETRVAVEKLRDVAEHWYQWHGPVTGPEHLRRWTEKKSGKFLAELYPSADFPQSGVGNTQHLDVIAGVLPMRELRRDLVYLASAIRRWLTLHRQARHS